MDRDFPPTISSSKRPNGGWRSSQNYSILLALKSSEIVINFALAKAVNMLKNTYVLICLSFV